jgi:hypothetical protein
MQHPDLTSQLAGERQARYRSDAARSRATMPHDEAEIRKPSVGYVKAVRSARGVRPAGGVAR